MICRYCGTRAQPGTIQRPIITPMLATLHSDPLLEPSPSVAFQWTCARCYEVNDNSDMRPASVITEWRGLDALTRGVRDFASYRWFIAGGATRTARAMRDNMGNHLWSPPITEGAPARFIGFLAKFLLNEREALVSFGHKDHQRVWHELREK